MIERHITFDVHPDMTAAFERFYADEYRPAMASSPGYIESILLREADSVTRYHIVLRFEDTESAAGWRTSEVHQGLQPALNVLHHGMEVQGYVVIA